MRPEWMEGVERWPRALPEFDFEPESTALLIVDMQNFCARSDMGLGQVLKDRFPDMYEYFENRIKIVMENNIRLLNFFRENGLRVIFSTTGPELADGSDYFTPRREKDRQLRKTSGVKTNFHKGTYEHEIVKELTPIEGEVVINKTSTGSFNSTGIDQTLRKLRVETLIGTGVATNACVEMTIRDAADRWYKCIMAEDACGTFCEEAHIGTLRNFARLYGMVWSTDEIIDYLGKKLHK